MQLSKLALSAPNADDLVFGAEGHVDDGFVFAVVKPLSSTEEQRSLFTTTSYGKKFLPFFFNTTRSEKDTIRALIRPRGRLFGS